LPADDVFADVAALAQRLDHLRRTKRLEKEAQRSRREARRFPNRSDRVAILAKAGRRCHLCGGTVDGDDWVADHVLAHSVGGDCRAENFLPAHRLCNQYRWDHGGEEFQWILKFGVWLRTQIEKQTIIGREAAGAFLAHERSRANRRKRKVGGP